MKALVIGASGATGREVVGHLLESSKWTSVVTLGRRQVDLPEKHKEVKEGKLQQLVVNMDTLAQERTAFADADVVFCTLGTTRAKAGSAAQFIKVDLTYVEEAAKAAKAANVPHFSLLTAQGANPRLWASNFPLVHPLLYARTKGLAEEAVKAQGFQRVSIFRPGLLERGTERSLPEKLLGSLTSGIPVADVAQGMVLDAEQPSKGLQVFDMKSLLAAAKAKAAPIAS